MGLGGLESKKNLGPLPYDFPHPILKKLMFLVWVLPELLAAIAG